MIFLRPLRLALSSLIALLLVVVSCAASAPPARAEAESRHFNVLLLGDSYIAGNGGGFAYEDPRGCFRSTSN